MRPDSLSGLDAMVAGGRSRLSQPASQPFQEEENDCL